MEVLAKPSDAAAPQLDSDQLEKTDILFSTFLPKDHWKMKNLKFIQIGSAGYAQLLGANLVERSIPACNASGVFDTGIGEWNLAMMVNMVRNLREMVRNQEHGIWDPGAQFMHSIRGRIVGLVGYGGLARETARLCKACGLCVHVLSRSGVGPRHQNYTVPGTGDPDGQLPDHVFSWDDINDFLKDLDFLILAIPLNAETRGLIQAEHLRRLPARAFLLNPARGPLIEESALLQALREGWIAGAALDTHYYYPMPPDHPLWRFPNVMMTPHIAGSGGGEYYLPRLWDLLLQNVERFQTGQNLLNVVAESDLEGAPA